MKYYKLYLKDFTKNFVLYVPLSIIFQSCLGSIAAMYILQSADIKDFPFFQLTLCVIVTMAYNASIMAQLKPKWVFNLLIVSIIINIILVFIN